MARAMAETAPISATTYLSNVAEPIGSWRSSREYSTNGTADSTHVLSTE